MTTDIDPVFLSFVPFGIESRQQTADRISISRSRSGLSRHRRSHPPPHPYRERHMKQIVFPGIFRRRNGNKKAAAAAATVSNAADDAGGRAERIVHDYDAAVIVSPPDCRIQLTAATAVGHARRGRREGRPQANDGPAVVAPTRVIDLTEAQNDDAAVTVSTLTNFFGPEATMKSTERLLAIQKDDNDDGEGRDGLASLELTYDGGGIIDIGGARHLSARDRAWYEEQVRLLDAGDALGAAARHQRRRSPATAGGEQRGTTTARDRGGGRNASRRPRPASAVGRPSSGYESDHRGGAERYSAGVAGHGRDGEPDFRLHSPRGVDEYEDGSKNGAPREEEARRREEKNRRRPRKKNGAPSDRRVRSPFPEDDDDDNARGAKRASGSAVEVFEDDALFSSSSSSPSLNDMRAIRDSIARIDERPGRAFPDDEEATGESFPRDASSRSESATMETRTTLESGTLGGGSLLETLDEVTLQETLDEITLQETLDESTLQGTLDDDAASATSSYVFEMVDDDAGGRQHRRLRREKHRRAVGRDAATRESRGGVVETSAYPARGRRRSTSSRSASESPARASRLGHHEDTSAGDDTDAFATEFRCPLPEIVEEITGTYADAASAFDQVLHAFFVSEDNVDKMADALRDAGIELAEMMYRDELEEEEGRMRRRGDVSFVRFA